MTEKKFEEAMERLENIVESLEKGDLSLEESLKFFEEGMKLVSFCSGKLEEAEQKVMMLIKDQSGKYSRQPFETGEKEDD
ncbi:MAG: exodeoxyribonuclease VII small subunit [Deltaproteobacteria bacterium]|nr:exodeoxyribonuclease VII small subunit [Deltaproteobacteria bacterium]